VEVERKTKPGKAMIKDSYKEFPFDDRTKEVWYILIDWGAKKTQGFSKVDEKEFLVRRLQFIVQGGLDNQFELQGVWHGEYSTDTFIIPIKEAYSELKKHFGKK
jgi:hypothetical protein